MLNQVVVVGRLISKEEMLDDKKSITIVLAVPRSFKNENGEYDTDFIDCKAYNGVAENVMEYCEHGDIIGVKGRIQKESNKPMEVVAEKVTFLSSNRNN